MAKRILKKAKKKASKKSAKKKTRRKAGRRTTMYSRGGKKLYAVRTAGGQFKDIQRYSRAHAMDIRRKAKDEK